MKIKPVEIIIILSLYTVLRVVTATR